MTRRRLILSAVLLLPLVGVGVYWAMQPQPEPGLNWANYCRLRKGMTLESVESIVGPYQYPLPNYYVGTRTCYQWRDGDVWVRLGFDARSELIYGEYGDDVHRDSTRLSRETNTEILRRWVKDWTGW